MNGQVIERCECLEWATVDSQMTMLTGHHENCEKRKSDRNALSELILDLVEGMEDWGNLEDGIPTEAWESYTLAKFFLTGEIVEGDNMKVNV